MSKCKRNILLIFGFLLIANILFVPCNKTNYGFSYTKETNIKKIRWESLEYIKVFFPFVISRAAKYKDYIKWESSVFLLFTKKIKVKMELEKEYNEIRKTKRTFSLDEIRVLDDEMLNRLIQESGLSQLAKLNMKIYEIHKEMNEIYEKKNKEFHDKFGYQTYYHQFRVKFFFIELALLILIGSLSYIFFCVVLRKIKEAGRDTIKKRKTGIILILMGVGIPLVFSQFQDRQKDVVIMGLEFPFGYVFAIGIILCLVGAGMVIFSFFPKDANPKK